MRPGRLFVRCPRVRVPERVGARRESARIRTPETLPPSGGGGWKALPSTSALLQPTSRHQAAHSTSALSPASEVAGRQRHATQATAACLKGRRCTTMAFGPASSAVNRWAPARVSEVRSPRHQERWQAGRIRPTGGEAITLLALTSGGRRGRSVGVNAAVNEAVPDPGSERAVAQMRSSPKRSRDLVRVGSPSGESRTPRRVAQATWASKYGSPSSGGWRGQVTR